MFSLSLHGGSFFKPAFFNYPEDLNLIISYSSDNFMFGDAFIVHPCLTEGETYVEAYFPYDLWYDWFTGQRVTLGHSKKVSLEAPLRGFVNIHMRGGYVIPSAVSYYDAMTVEELRYSNITLVIASDPRGIASGFMNFDDGVSPDTISKGEYTLVNYLYQEMNTTFSTLSFV